MFLVHLYTPKSGTGDCWAIWQANGLTFWELSGCLPKWLNHFILPLAVYEGSSFLWHADNMLCLVAQLCLTLWNSMDCSPPGSSAHGDSPGKNTGVGCHALFQGIFPTQELNPRLPHCGRILYHLSHQGRPRILDWIAYSFSKASSQPRNWTGVSCIARGFFISWATRDVL